MRALFIASAILWVATPVASATSAEKPEDGSVEVQADKASSGQPALEVLEPEHRAQVVDSKKGDEPQTPEEEAGSDDSSPSHEQDGSSLLGDKSPDASPPQEPSTAGSQVFEEPPIPPKDDTKAPAPKGFCPEDMAEIERALELDHPPDEDFEGLIEERPLATQTIPRAAPPASSMNPEISFIFNAAFAAFSAEPRQTGAHDPLETGFNFQQLELAVSSSVDPYFRFDTFVVFSLFGVEIEEAYATTLALPFSLQARIGHFLTRAGRINPTHPHDWLFEDQPLVLGKMFGGENNRGLGLEVSWLAPLPWYVETIWSINDGRGASTARSFWGGDAMPVESPLDFQNMLALRQFFPLSDNLSLMLGATGMTGPNPTGPYNRTDIFAADVYLRWRPITHGRDDRHAVLQAEAWNRRRQVPDDLLVDYGGYAQAVFRFATRWETGIRSELVTGVEDDPLDPEWSSDRQRHSAVLTFRPTEFSRLRLQIARDEADWFDTAVHSAFFAVEFGVGAHAAHPF